MDALTLLLETVIYPSFFVGFVVVALLWFSAGRPGVLVAGVAQSLAMAVGVFIGVVAVLDRVPLPPVDFQGRLLAGLLALGVVLAGVAWGQAWRWALVAGAGMATAAVAWYVLPASMGGAERWMGMGLAGLAASVALVAFGAVVPASVPAAEGDGASMRASVDNLADRWVAGPALLGWGSALAGVLLLGGSASLGQVAGVVCSVAGPAVVFGLLRREWGMAPVAAVLPVAAFSLLALSGNRMANAHLGALALWALAPAALAVLRTGAAGPQSWVKIGGALAALALLSTGALGIAVAMQPEESW